MHEYSEIDVWRMEKALKGLKAELAECENRERCRNIRKEIENLEYELAIAKRALGM